MVPCWHTGGLTPDKIRWTVNTPQVSIQDQHMVGNTMQLNSALHNLLELASFEVARVLTTTM